MENNWETMAVREQESKYGTSNALLIGFDIILAKIPLLFFVYSSF